MREYAAYHPSPPFVTACRLHVFALPDLLISPSSRLSAVGNGTAPTHYVNHANKCVPCGALATVSLQLSIAMGVILLVVAVVFWGRTCIARSQAYFKVLQEKWCPSKRTQRPQDGTESKAAATKGLFATAGLQQFGTSSGTKTKAVFTFCE